VYLSINDVVERYAGVWSRWQIRDQARRAELPNVKLPGRKGILFRVDDLELFEAGASELETVKLPKGGRICRPRALHGGSPQRGASAGNKSRLA
jgi:hypothetical protein